nr:uncharacterized protein LOC109167867 [Ipomoea trifida]
MRLFFRVRVLIDVTKPLKKHMKLKRDDGAWSVVDFRFERLLTFYFLCGIIGHGDKVCIKALHGVDPTVEKPFGAYMRAGVRRAVLTAGQRWVAPESNVERQNWKSPNAEIVESNAITMPNQKGKELQSDDGAEIFGIVMNEQKRKRTEGDAEGSNRATIDMDVREDKCREIITNSWSRTMGLDVLSRIETCGSDLWRWGKSYNREFQRKIDVCKARLETLRMRRDGRGFNEYSSTERELLSLLNQQHVYWKQRAKEHWYKHGDLNTKYFHNAVKSRRRRNRITRLRREDGLVVESVDDMGEVMTEYFSDLFTASQCDMEEVLDCITTRLRPEENNRLLGLVVVISMVDDGLVEVVDQAT